MTTHPGNRRPKGAPPPSVPLSTRRTIRAANTPPPANGEKNSLWGCLIVGPVALLTTTLLIAAATEALT